MPVDRLDVLVSLCKRRGFAYPSGDIHAGSKIGAGSKSQAGSRAAWDYGPLGVELKNNVKREWWKTVVTARDDVVGLDSCVVLPSPVWEASGHVAEFVDSLTECQSCRRRFPVKMLVADYVAKRGRQPKPGFGDLICPDCGARGAFSSPKRFSKLLRTRLGAVAESGGDGEESVAAYLRPEGSQGILINYAHVQQSSRRKPPFGIAQIGKSFRDEANPGDFLFRTVEFERMELGFFVKPGTDEHWHQCWIDFRRQWYVDLGLNKDDIRLFERPKTGARSAKRTVDIEYRFDFIGKEWDELEGVANRADADLVAHSARSGANLSYFDQDQGLRWTPYVIESAVGVDRAMLCFLLDAYSTEEVPNAKGGTDKRVVLRLDYRLAPVKVAVLPLSRNAELSPRARLIAAELRQHWNVDFDDSGAIGRRYRRQDEIGTPYCVTVDFQSLDDQAVTVRERDTMTQRRVALSQLESYLGSQLPGC